jgi:hypothetical protein
MPQQKTSSRTNLARLVLLAFLGWALMALRGLGVSAADRTDATTEGRVSAARAGLFSSRRRTRSRKRRLASSLAFATLFFAGAALSAGAGDMIVGSPDDGTTTTTTTTADDPDGETPPDEGTAPDDGTVPDEGTAPDESTPDDGTPAEPPAEDTPAEPADDATDPAAPGDPATDPTTDPTTPADETESPATTPDDAGGSDDTGSGPTTTGPKTPGKTHSGPPVVTPNAHENDEALQPIDPETDAFGASTIWLHRTLPDPTPPAKRLAPGFARMLREESSMTGAGWAVVLAALRADGGTGRWPAQQARTHAVATRLAASKGKGEWLAFLALRGKTAWADQAQALARYNRAVGLRALVKGLDASKGRLARRVLADHRITIYAGGRMDIASGKTDVRVLVLIRYLAEAHGQVTVSSLTSGHRLYARPGVVSAHVYGLAVDIAVLDNQSIYGHQQPGGITEQAVRNILLLPAEISPRQVISLLGLGGASFPLADHDDHIHVGF